MHIVAFVSSDLAEMYARSPRAVPSDFGHASLMPMLLICITLLLRLIHWVYYTYMPERFEYGYATSNVAATI